MTTKLNKKLNYAIESKNLITTALQKKGAQIDDKTPFREVSSIIDNLQTQSPNKDFLSSYTFNQGDKVMIQKNQKNLPLQKGSFTGNLVGDFIIHVSNFGCCYQDIIYLGFYNSTFFAYRFDRETQTIYPLRKRTTSVKSSVGKRNPIHQNLGVNYILSPENEDVFSALSYPSGGNFSNFATQYAFFDSKGDYLIQYNQSNGLFDILKLIFNEETNTYSYTLITSQTLASSHNIAEFSRTSGDINTSHTFALGGKTIFKINPNTHELSSFNILDVITDIENPDILLFGQNYLVLVNGLTSARKVYFIKATPIDETLALNDEGFYDNPTNYTYTLLHEEATPNLPNEALCWNQNNIYSPINPQLNYYIHVKKERIDDMSDFNYEFGSVSGDIIYGFYMDENTFISYALKESGSTKVNPQMCLLYKRENPQHPFDALETTFQMGCFCLNENGAGVFNSSNTAFMGKLKENNPELIKATGVGDLSPATLFLKNSALSCSVYAKKLSYQMCPDVSEEISIRYGISAVIDEEFLSNTYSGNVYYFPNTGTAIPLTFQDTITSHTSSFIFKYKQEYYFFDFLNTTGSNIQGTVRKATFDIENKKIILGEVQNAFASFNPISDDLIFKVKHQDLWITTTCLFGLIKDENNNFHFIQISFPSELVQAFNGETPAYIQTFYDGTCGFLFEEGRTLIAHIEWDGFSNRASLKEGTSIQTISSDFVPEGTFYTYLSPFKVYKSIFNSQEDIIHCTYANPNQMEKYEYHLAPNIKDNWDETVTIASISKEPYYDEEGYKMQNVTLSFE